MTTLRLPRLPAGLRTAAQTARTWQATAAQDPARAPKSLGPARARAPIGGRLAVADWAPQATE